MIPEKHTQQPVWPNMGNIANMTYEMLPKRKATDESNQDLPSIILSA